MSKQQIYKIVATAVTALLTCLAIALGLQSCNVDYRNLRRKQKAVNNKERARVCAFFCINHRSCRSGCLRHRRPASGAGRGRSSPS